METKVFLSQQLICMLPPVALKVMAYLLNWQKVDVIKYFPTQMCGFLHMGDEDLDLGLQTLINHKLIDVSNVDGQWVFQINKETVNKYFNVKLQTIKEHSGIEMAKEITWKKEEEKKDVHDMSNEELKLLLLRVQATMAEREQMKKVVETNDDDGLPW